ncbi:MAG TPA: DEAD/DEAH box helicase [Acidilobales archaeon]|nr:DEAD/DEAH box helicase [Acidilobales archaeon]
MNERKELIFKVDEWLEDDEFRELLSISDYIGRKGNSSIFKLNIPKVVRKGLSPEDVLNVLDSVDADYDANLFLQELSRVIEGKEVVFEYVSNKIVMKPKFFLGSLYDEVKDFVKYDRETKTFYVRPMYFFKLIDLLESRGVKVINKTGLRRELKLNINVKFKGELRPYQEEALDSWLRNRSKGVIALPTGSGKTIIAIAALAKLSERTLIVTYTKEQMFQWGELIKRFTNIPEFMIGYFHSGEKKVKPITIITYQSAFRYIERLTSQFSFLVVDECHHLPADKFKYIAENSVADKRMGLSATIYREDGKHEILFPLMGGVVYYKTPAELTELGYLAPYRIITKYVSLLPSERKEYIELKRKYRELVGFMPFEEVLRSAREGNKVAIEALRLRNTMRILVHKSKSKIYEVKKIVDEELRRGSKVIVFTQYVDQAETLAKVLNAMLLTGETEDRRRREILKRFKNIDKGVLVVTTVGDEGLDIPDANVGIIVTGSGSRRQFIQRLGRLLRPKEGKEARLYEIVVRGTTEELQAKKRKESKLDEEFIL